MSHFTNHDAGCDDVRDDLSEFALGALSGRERSKVVDHLEGCSACRAELESLASVVDTMLLLAPEVDPPVGFELRVAHRLNERVARRTLPRRFRPLAVAAALVIGVVGIGVGVVIESQTGPNATPVRASMATLSASGHAVGQVFISDTTPSWMFMTLDDGGYTGVVWCRVTLADGHQRTLGRFTLSHGYGAWMARVGTDARHVHTAELVDATGAVVARASFAA